jgi:hypothetical protein
VQTVHVLKRIESVEDPSRIMTGLQRQLDEYAVHVFVAIRPLDFPEKLFRGRPGGKPDGLRAAACLFGRAGLGADVRFRGWISTEKDDSEAGERQAPCGKARDLCAKRLPKTARQGGPVHPAVDRPGIGHDGKDMAR